MCLKYTVLKMIVYHSHAPTYHDTRFIESENITFLTG